MADFLEERIDHQKIKMGAAFTEGYDVNVVASAGGNEYRSLIHPFPRRTFDISQLLEKQETYSLILALYHRAHGQYAGFRIKCYDEFSSNGATGAPTPFDQVLTELSPGVYEMRKYYGTSGAAGASGYPYRKIKKPVAGKTRVGIQTTEIRSADWSVDTTTGLVTFAADQTRSITAISKASSAVLDVGAGHPFVVGMSVHISNVVGMTQINGLRALVTAIGASTITLAINSTAFSTYTSGGVVHTRPQAGEQATCGFEFDFPVRFNGSLVVSQDHYRYRNADGISLVELLNP